MSSGVVRWLNGEAQHRRRSHVDLVDLVRLDLGLDGEAVAVRHDQHHRLAGLDHATHRVHALLEDLAVPRRHQVDALQLILGGDPLLDQLGFLARMASSLPASPRRSISCG